ncbi:MAG: carbohydrate kinase [Bacteroidetes bacterium GWF2_38_335]|nr:MAG: carbohydrate kinase [Bacteroidetes bacterium GWF2_38_335]OFY78151.1 MAG: carbohydrate kinase [Bacteroidetes bacterium RIFOXYA12_FULL_38_20]HBS88692.1 D-glycero-beta-D-manno-heptose-7-phosphate kinase [Bacteroidales bacterium]
MKNDFKKLFESFNNKNILIIGDVMVDAYIWGKVERISPEAPVPVVSITQRENRPGGAANVALNIKALGANPIICSVIGEDEKGLIFKDMLKSNGMISDAILTCSLRKTTSKTRVISNGQHLLRVDEEITSPLDHETEQSFIAHLATIIKYKKIDAIIFEDYDKGVITPTVIDNLVNIAGKLNIPVTVDPKKNNFCNYNGVTLFKPNFKELKEGLKLDIEKGDFEGLFKAALVLHKEYQQKFVMITLSELGVFISDGEKYQVIPAEFRDIVDVSGAGDTVISVATLCLCLGLPTEEIARVSNCAGGLVCEKVGVVPINKDELLTEILK